MRRKKTTRAQAVALATNGCYNLENPDHAIEWDDALVDAASRRDDAAGLTILYRTRVEGVSARTTFEKRAHRHFVRFMKAGMPRTFALYYRMCGAANRPCPSLLWVYLRPGRMRLNILRAMVRAGLSSKAAPWFRGDWEADRTPQGNRNITPACLTWAEWRVLFPRNGCCIKPQTLIDLAGNPHGLFLRLNVKESTAHLDFAPSEGLLFRAVESGDAATVEWLIAGGLSPSPMLAQLALQRNRRRILRHLEAHGIRADSAAWTDSVPNWVYTSRRQALFWLSKIDAKGEPLRDEISATMGSMPASVMSVFATVGINPSPSALLVADSGSRVRRLISLGIPVNTTFEEGNTALHVVSEPHAIRTLLRCGADPLATNSAGSSAFGKAMRSGHYQLAWTMFNHWCSSTCRTASELLMMLHEWTASDSDAPDSAERETPSECLQIMERIFIRLKEMGVKWDAPDENGLTALWWSAYHGAVPTSMDRHHFGIFEVTYPRVSHAFRLLLNHGADPSILLKDLRWETNSQNNSPSHGRTVLAVVPWTEEEWAQWMESTTRFSQLAFAALQNPSLPAELRRSLSIAGA